MGLAEGISRLPFLDFLRQASEAKRAEPTESGVDEAGVVASQSVKADTVQDNQATITIIPETQAEPVDRRQAMKDLAGESRAERFSQKPYQTPGVERLKEIPQLGSKQIASIGRNNPEEGEQIARGIRTRRTQNLDLHGISRRNNF